MIKNKRFMALLTIVIPQELKNELYKEAKETNIPLSEYVTALLVKGRKK